jgi:hypothetical protein
MIPSATVVMFSFPGVGACGAQQQARANETVLQCALATHTPIVDVSCSPRSPLRTREARVHRRLSN